MSWKQDKDGNIYWEEDPQYGAADPRKDPRLTSAPKERKVTLDDLQAKEEQKNNKSYSGDSTETPATDTSTDTDFKVPDKFQYQYDTQNQSNAGNTNGSWWDRNGSSASAGAGLVGAAAGSGNYAAAAGGAYNLYDMSQGDNRYQYDTRAGYARGASSGAAIGSMFGPWGQLIGAAAGAAYGSGRFATPTPKYTTSATSKQIITPWDKSNFTTIGGLLNKQGKSRTKVEQERWAALEKQGIKQPEEGRQGWFGNEVWKAQGGDEKYLLGKDIKHAAIFYMNMSDWDKLPDNVKEEIAQRAIDYGAVKQHHATIDVDFTNLQFRTYLEKKLAYLNNPKQTVPDTAKQDQLLGMSASLSDISKYREQKTPDYSALLKNPYS